MSGEDEAAAITWQYDVPEGEAESGGYGPAIDGVWELADGTMWAGNGEYLTRVNFCPFTGREAREKIYERPGIGHEQYRLIGD